MMEILLEAQRRRRRCWASRGESAQAADRHARHGEGAVVVISSSHARAAAAPLAALARGVESRFAAAAAGSAGSAPSDAGGNGEMLADAADDDESMKDVAATGETPAGGGRGSGAERLVRARRAPRAAASVRRVQPCTSGRSRIPKSSSGGYARSVLLGEARRGGPRWRRRARGGRRRRHRLVPGSASNMVAHVDGHLRRS